ncbi:MAG TPA: cellulose synthase, partial [Polyangiaceae bacterium]|nr:cellulose synthase [Polyangiaceae bacterium]
MMYGTAQSSTGATHEDEIEEVDAAELADEDTGADRATDLKLPPSEEAKPAATFPAATTGTGTAARASDPDKTAVHRSASVRPSARPGYSMARDPRAEDDEPPQSTADTASPLDKELRLRAERLKHDDPLGAARAHLELGLLAEWLVVDRDRSKKHYEAARGLSRTLGPALLRLRRTVASQAALSGMPTVGKELLHVLEDELTVAETNEARADLLAMRARVFEAVGDLPAARAQLTKALELAPKHAPSLHGLEVVLRREADSDVRNAKKDLAEHLAKLSEAYLPDGSDGDAALSAWISVERAELCEDSLKDVPAAREALKRAVALAPQPGPTRNAFVRHLAKNDRDAGLAEALRVEADREQDPERSSRLFYASARISLDRLGARGDGVTALNRAEQKATAGTLHQERVLAELTAQLDQDADHARLVEIRQKRLTLLTGREALAHEHLRLSDAYGRVGRPDLAADAAVRALAQEPANRGARDVLDQTLQRLGRHAERVRTWLAEANADLPVRTRVSAYVRAADIARRHLGQSEQSIELLRAAWLIDPGNPQVFDGLAVLLRPERTLDEAAQRNAEARVDLYEQAARTETERERRIGYLEKVLAIWEDELERPEKASETAERILEIDPKRRSAVIALERCARRANDHERLLRALEDDAKTSDDTKLRVRLLLEAAEVIERQGDREKALVSIGKALDLEAGHADAIRARVALLRRMGRTDEARKSLVALADADPSTAFETWLEVAEIDESLRRAPLDAVEAYRKARELRPSHPLPLLALVRLLRSTKNFKRLVAELKTLARTAADAKALAQVQVMCAEVEELCLGEDEGALKSLDAADEALNAGDAPIFDPYLFESSERILFRVGSAERLSRLYAKWLERKPPATIDHGLRVALASALEAQSPQQAVDVLEGLVSVVPTHLPALRRLEHLHRSRKNWQALQAVLYAQAGFVTSRLARVGALWEVASLEDRVGATVTLDALSRVVREFAQDTGALDTLIRVASRILAAGGPAQQVSNARAHLLAALRQRRELSVDPMGRAAFLLEEAMLTESGEERDLAASLGAYKEALSLWPDSLLAAKGVERIASHVGDHAGVISSQLALAKLVDDKAVKATHFVRAAELTHSHLRDERTALELYEVALETDAENRSAGKALVAMLSSEPRRLIEILRPRFEKARSRDQIISLGTEIATAYLKVFQKEGDGAHLDYAPGIAALQRALEFAPDDVGGLFTLARLYTAQKAYAEARASLTRIVEIAKATDPKTRQLALFALVDLYEGPLGDLALAE